MAQKDFHHPYQPYGIQQKFMEDVYGMLEDATGGIMESPTGTVGRLSCIIRILTKYVGQIA